MEERFDVDQCLGFITNRSFRIFQKAIDEKLSEHGLTSAQFYVLARLLEEENLTQTELASRIHIESPTLVPTLDRMEAAEIIERCPHPRDRRAYSVCLLPKGRALAPVIHEVGTALNRKATEGLNEEECKTLRKHLNLLRKNLGGS